MATIIDKFYKSKELKDKFYSHYSPYLEIPNNKSGFLRVWNSVCDKFSYHFLFDFFDNINIKIGIVPLPSGNWGYKIINENNILICNDFKTRQEAIEESINKSIEIYDQKRANN